MAGRSPVHQYLSALAWGAHSTPALIDGDVHPALPGPRTCAHEWPDALDRTRTLVDTALGTGLR